VMSRVCVAFAPAVPRTNSVGHDSYQLQVLTNFCNRFFCDGGWFLAHLCDLLDHAVTADGCAESAAGPQRIDAAHFILEFGNNLAQCPARMWELATNYYRFCCHGVNTSSQNPSEFQGNSNTVDISLDADLGEGFAVETLLHHPLSCEKAALKVIHTARHSLPPVSAQTVNADIGKIMAARYWPLPKQTNEGEQSMAERIQVQGGANAMEWKDNRFQSTEQVKIGRPGMCAFWLRDHSSSQILEKLTEQLVVGLLHTEVDTAAANRLDRDCKAVYDVLNQLMAGKGSTPTLFVEFYTVWKMQLGLVQGTHRIDPKTFTQHVLHVFDNCLVPHKFWLKMFQHLLLPLLNLPWRGHVFDVDDTYALLRHFETAVNSARFAGDLYDDDSLCSDDIRYALVENLSEASINSIVGQ